MSGARCSACSRAALAARSAGVSGTWTGFEVRITVYRSETDNHILVALNASKTWYAMIDVMTWTIY